MTCQKCQIGLIQELMTAWPQNLRAASRAIPCSGAKFDEAWINNLHEQLYFEAQCGRSVYDHVAPFLNAAMILQKYTRHHFLTKKVVQCLSYIVCKFDSLETLIDQSFEEDTEETSAVDKSFLHTSAMKVYFVKKNLKHDDAGFTVLWNRGICWVRLWWWRKFLGSMIHSCE